jgi:hypothetical protein
MHGPMNVKHSELAATPLENHSCPDVSGHVQEMGTSKQHTITAPPPTWPSRPTTNHDNWITGPWLPIASRTI